MLSNEVFNTKDAVDFYTRFRNPNLLIIFYLNFFLINWRLIINIGTIAKKKKVKLKLCCNVNYFELEKSYRSNSFLRLTLYNITDLIKTKKFLMTCKYTIKNN